MSHGHEVAAARLMGADFAYLGTRFIATKESLADQGFKQMIVDSTSSDIVYTPAISGVNANFLRPSIVAAGRDPDNLTVDANSALHLEGEPRFGKTSGLPVRAWAASKTFPRLSNCACVSPKNTATRSPRPRGSWTTPMSPQAEP